MSLADLLRRELTGVLELAPEQLDALTRHYELLLRWNQKMNLTTVTELPEAGIRHYCESLFLASHLSAGSVVDIGSGAGFPGIPVAIARPDCVVDLVESHQRKAVFLREFAREVPKVGVISSRAESLLAEPGYSWLISRAVNPASLQKLRLADRYALLVGAEEANKMDGRVIPLPWGDRRVLVMGSCSTWNR